MGQRTGFIRILELLLGLGVVAAGGWALISHYLNRKPPALPKQLQTARQALIQGNEQLASSIFDSYLSSRATNPQANQFVLAACDTLPSHPKTLLHYAYQAVKNCRQADDATRAELYVTEAEAYSEQKPPLGERVKAAAQQALVLQPHDPQIQNAVGYLIADTSCDMTDLDQAESLIIRALQKLQNPITDNDRQMLALCEDSYGWALYRKGCCGSPANAQREYDRAANALLQASVDIPSDTPASEARVVFYHLGEAYKQAGKLEQAIQAFRVAIHYDPSYSQALQAQGDLQKMMTATPPPSPSPLSSKAFTPLSSKRLTPILATSKNQKS